MSYVSIYAKDRYPIQEYDYLSMNHTPDDPIMQLWNTASIWEYAVCCNGHKVTDPQEENYLNMRVLTPKEVIVEKYGTCWDQSLAIAYMAYTSGLQYKFVFYSDTRCSSHSFCLVKHPTVNAWFYIESAYQRIKGVYGPFSKLDRAYDWTLDKLYLTNVKQFNLSYYGYMYLREDMPIQQLFNDKHIDMYKFYNVMGMNKDKLEAIANPSSPVMARWDDVKTDKQHRVVSIRYHTSVYGRKFWHWDAFKGDYA